MTARDTEWLVALKEAAMRPDLERLGAWDPDRSRRRLLEELAPASTWLVLLAGQRVGSVALPWMHRARSVLGARRDARMPS